MQPGSTSAIRAGLKHIVATPHLVPMALIFGLGCEPGCGDAGQPSHLQFGSAIPEKGRNDPALLRDRNDGASSLAWHPWRSSVFSLFHICATAYFLSGISLGRVRLSRFPASRKEGTRVRRQAFRTSWSIFRVGKREAEEAVPVAFPEVCVNHAREAWGFRADILPRTGPLWCFVVG